MFHRMWRTPRQPTLYYGDMKFFSRRQRQEPRGLYRQDKPAQEMMAERRKIQQHNKQVLLKTEKALRKMPLYFSRLRAADPIKLPDLWCNSSDPGDQRRGRFSLLFITIEPDRDGSISAKISILDHEKNAPAAIRDWQFTPVEGKQTKESPDKYRYVKITSSIDTILGYEGNGFGTGLMLLSDVVVERVMEVVLADKVLALSRFGRDVHWLAQVNDSAETAVQAMPQPIPQPDDAPTSRDWWTSNIASQLPGYTSDRQAVAQELGFFPSDMRMGYDNFFKVYR